MSNICITGAAGLLGQNLVNLLKLEHNILCLDIADNPFDENRNISYLQADLTDFSSVRERIKNHKPDYLFNCAALTDVDRCENEKALADKLNFELVNHLLAVARGRIIHYSSDYVFNGNDGPYAETDPVEPINYYGVTKLHSENILIQSKLDYLIIRTNVLYGRAINTRDNFVTWVIDSLKRGESIKVVDDQFNNPTLAENLAGASVEAALEGIQGLLHIAGDEYLCRYEAASVIADIFGFNHELIARGKTSEISQKAKRPHYGGLKIDKAKNILKTRLLGLTDGIKLIKSLG